MKILFGFILALAAGGTAGPLRAQALSLELMTGSALNLPTVLTVRQSGYPDLRFSADYDTKPFGPNAPYYAWRLGLWEGGEAWEIGQIHHRLYLTNPPPEIQFFAIHYGYSYFFLGHAWKRGGFIYHLGLGPIFTNPENTVRGQKLYTAGEGFLDTGYYLSGMGFQAALGKNLYLNERLYLILETSFTAGFAWAVPVVNGTADVPNLALHGHIGTGYNF